MSSETHTPLPPETTAFLQHLRSAREPFLLKADGQPPVWADAALHRQSARRDPERTALLGLLESVQPGQRARLLFCALEASRGGLPAEERARREASTGALLRLLDPDAVLTVFLALRRVRANHKHVTRAILTYLLDHPQAEDLWVRRRAAIADCLEHAIGKSVLRTCVRHAVGPVSEAADVYLRRNVLRFASDWERARRLLALLAVSGAEAAHRRPTVLASIASHHQVSAAMFPRPERPATITAEDRGEVAAAVTALYRQEARAGLRARFTEGLNAVVVRCPRFEGKVVVVLDASTSLQGYGDRAFCLLAQSVAFRLTLERVCRELVVVPVGAVSAVDAAGALPLPAGATDLATGLLDALAAEPDLVLIVSDGYENRYRGDLARVAATIRTWEHAPSVVFCQTQFTRQDDLTQRRPVRGILPEASFWHEADFPETLVDAFAGTAPGWEGILAHLRERAALALRIAREIEK